MAKIVRSNEALNTEVDLKAPLASPALTGTPTAPTATAGTNTTQLATTAFVKAKSELDSIGVNQTWQDVTSERASGITYTNTTGKPIVVGLHSTCTSIQNVTYLLIYVDGIVIDFIDYAGSQAVQAVVPNNSTYACTVGVNAGIPTWVELR